MSPIDGTVWLAIIGLVSLVVSSIIAPSVVAVLMRKLSREEKNADAAAAKIVRDEDHARQDRVAREVREVKETAAIATSGINGKLDVIHTLVNSSMTAAMQSEHDATVRELAMMNEVIALNRAAGRAPSKEALAALLSTDSKITELRATLAERAKQTDIALDRASKVPLPVTDERTATAAEQTAAAAVETAAAVTRSAIAGERMADAAEEVAKKSPEGRNG